MITKTTPISEVTGFTSSDKKLLFTNGEINPDVETLLKKLSEISGEFGMIELSGTGVQKDIIRGILELINSCDLTIDDLKK